MTSKTARPQTRLLSRAGFVAAASVVAGGLTTGLAGGCAHRHEPGRAQFLPHPAGELQTLGATSGENENRLLIYNDIGRRLILEDFATMWHFDRPTKLSRFPIPY